jgi:hypothetical protein
MNYLASIIHLPGVQVDAFVMVRLTMSGALRIIEVKFVPKDGREPTIVPFLMLPIDDVIAIEREVKTKIAMNWARQMVREDDRDEAANLRGSSGG